MDDGVVVEGSGCQEEVLMFDKKKKGRGVDKCIRY